MANHQNIQDYRRKKRLKRLLRNVLLAVLIVAALFGLLYLFDAFRGSPVEKYLSNRQEETPDLFPLTLKKEQLLGLGNSNGDLAVLTKASLLFYDTTGKRLANQPHGYTNPVMKISGKRVMTYDRGGTKLRLDAASGSIGEITTQTAILTAEISPSGYVAVATSYRANVWNINVYDENLELLYRKITTVDYTAMAFSSDDMHVMLCSLDSPNGLLGAKLSEVDRTSTQKETEPVAISNILPIRIGYLNGGVMVAGKDSSVFVKGKNGLQTRYEYQGDLQRMAFIGEQALALVNQNLFSTYSTLSLLDGSEAVKSTELHDEVLDLCGDGSKLVLLGKNNIAWYNMSLKQLGEKPLAQSFQKITLIGENAYLMGEDSIVKFPIE